MRSENTKHPYQECWGLSENSEYVNPEMRETLGFLFQNRRFVKPEKAG